MTAATRPQPSPRVRLRTDRGMPLRHRQRGVALLVAILLVALGTIIAAAMAYNNAMTARRTAATFGFDQSLLIVEGAEAFAAYGLQWESQQNPQYIAAGQRWSQPFGPREVAPGVTLQASLEDLQGRFNINNLVQNNGETPNTPAIQAFQRLLTMLNMDPKWANYIVDWIDKDTVPMFPDGAEDSVYMEMNPPYRTPNLPISSTSELMALPGFTRADFDKLAPYIAALPIGTQINVCSAKPRLLDALAGVVQFSGTDPKQFEQERADNGCFPAQTMYVSDIQDPNLKKAVQGMTGQKSSWFRLTSFVDIGSTEFSVYTLLYLDQTGMVRPIMRSFTPD